MFLDHYYTPHRKACFDAFESAYHIYSALDFLVFSVKVGNRETESRLQSFLDSVGTIRMA